ncbi:MAG: hypothetical protein ABI237_03720 [Ginsengibacter sp.]
MEFYCFFSLFTSCNFYSDRNLGANYWFWEDGNQSEIVYDENEPQGGFTIIDANVSQYNFNDKYIIAKSNWLLKNGIDAYWIIDKRISIKKDTSKVGKQYEHELKKGLVGPLGKDSFEFLMKKNTINLQLEDDLK